MTERSRFIPVSDWADHHPWPTPGALRVHICNAEKRVRTGQGVGDPALLACVVRVGKRVLINENKFFDWVNNHGLNNATTNSGSAV